MGFSLLILATTIAVVVPVELPDKTLIATLILTTRYRGEPVLVGVSAAFAVQCTVAVGFGTALTLLPSALVSGVVTALFTVGAVMLLREGFSRQDTVNEGADPSGPPVGFWHAAATSFGVLFVAEWGDASQLATAALAARYHAPLEVWLGSFLALVGIAAVAVLLGRKIRDRLPTKVIQRVAGFLFAAFALVGLVETLLAL